MLYYLGKGKEFKKEDCKEYKTKDGAVKAMQKTGDGAVWDENGKIVTSMVIDANPHDVEAIAESNGNRPEKDSKEDEQQIIVPQGTMKIIVVCDGALNLRRSPEWGNSNICGRAVRGQSYYVKEIHMAGGKKMVKTIDDLYISGDPQYVRFEQL